MFLHEDVMHPMFASIASQLTGLTFLKLVGCELSGDGTINLQRMNELCTLELRSLTMSSTDDSLDICPVIQLLCRTYFWIVWTLVNLQ